MTQLCKSRSQECVLFERAFLIAEMTNFFRIAALLSATGHTPYRSCFRLLLFDDREFALVLDRLAAHAVFGNDLYLVIAKRQFVCLQKPGKCQPFARIAEA